MATKRYCDRCGKECGSWRLIHRIEFPVLKSHILDIERYDICGGCAEELSAFMNFAEGEKVVK